MKGLRVITFLFLMLFVLTPTFAADNYTHKGNCPQLGGQEVPCNWRFFKCECTSYVACRLNALWQENGHYSYDTRFWNYYRRNQNDTNTRWGWASDWHQTAQDALIVVSDEVWMVGDIAWWNNHVAFIERINIHYEGDCDQNDVGENCKRVLDSIELSEYNYPSASNGNK